MPLQRASPACGRVKRAAIAYCVVAQYQSYQGVSLCKRRDRMAGDRLDKLLPTIPPWGTPSNSTRCPSTALFTAAPNPGRRRALRANAQAAPDRRVFSLQKQTTDCAESRLTPPGSSSLSQVRAKDYHGFTPARSPPGLHLSCPPPDCLQHHGPASKRPGNLQHSVYTRRRWSSKSTRTSTVSRALGKLN